MQKFFVFLALLAGVPLTGQCQSLRTSPPPSQFEKAFSGALNASLKFQMRLLRQGDELTGSYTYDKRKKGLRLQGTINEQGYFQMNEIGAQDTITGHFVGAFTGAGTIVGFWSKEFSGTPKLPFVAAEIGQSASPHKLQVITARVPRDAGTAQLLLIDNTILEFTYENVGARAHTCTLTSDRSEPRVQWTMTADATTLHFPPSYFNNPPQSATVVIQPTAQGYAITFEGNLPFFCGMRARLPRKISLRRTSNGWVGEK